MSKVLFNDSLVNMEFVQFISLIREDDGVVLEFTFTNSNQGLQVSFENEDDATDALKRISKLA